jgi:hypothetical protein
MTQVVDPTMRDPAAASAGVQLDGGVVDVDATALRGREQDSATMRELAQRREYPSAAGTRRRERTVFG